ncbi:TLC domain-containing protein 3A [Colias croceus]|uniref:TLC domain-containing protein 3A n=1 Tax=Colias crocea TaxID=72248 RepID=UPI001E27ED4B|nr:TLC domain-containing protein 3A [Colias croceus]
MEVATSKAQHHGVVLGFLGACNAASLFAALQLVCHLDPEDSISKTRGGALTLLGFVYFMTLFELFNVAALFTGLGERFRNKYRLSSGDVLDITNKLVSAVQAAFCCAAGAVVCLWSCTRDLVRTSHYISEAYAWFGAAYFFYDIWSMYMVYVHMTTNIGYHWRLTKDRSLAAGDSPSKPSFLTYCRHEPVILMHHLFIGSFGFLVIVYFRGGLGDCIFGFVYLMELSTPFVSLRGILSRLRLKKTRLYVFNGLAMLASFLLCRVLSLPYVFLLYSRAKGVTYLEAISSLPTGCKVSICILLLPQLYWFCLMASGALKLFTGKAKQS